jgi:diacylglycerol kinase family enzyme
MRRFEVEYCNGAGARKQVSLTELLAVRIRFFGNILRELVPGASLDCGQLRAVMCRTASRSAYLQYVAGRLIGRHWDIDGIDLVSCPEFVCKLPEKTMGHEKEEEINEERIYVEADGELLGHLPARMTMAPDCLSLVVPA